MPYLIRLALFCILLIPSMLDAGRNPFSVVFEAEPLKLQGELRQTIKVTVKSNSIEETKYHLKLEIPKAHMSILDGRAYYDGELGPLKSRDMYISVKLRKAGEGRISSMVYGYIDDREIDMDNPNKFYANYSVSRSTKTAGKDFILSVASTGEDTPEASGMDKDDKFASEQKPDQEQLQRFVLDSKSRPNSFFRSILFVLSFFLIGWFYYRVLNRPKS